ncbi:MAG: outer membrane beta-barrel protein [Bacteroidetes bacterium]|nr:outer membrane beta-barrel protein [Bacteroidota bacterium]
MRKKLVRSLFALCVSAASLPAIAQPAIPREYVEHPGFSIGTNFGMTDLWGDVGTQSVVDHYSNGKYFDKPCFMGGLFGRFTPHPSVGFRLGINYGTLYATDAWNEDKAKKAKSIEDDAFQRYLRNQDIKSNVWEGTFQFELFPFRANSESRSAMRRWQPYLTFGVGVFHYKPYSSFIDRGTLAKKWVAVDDLHLEGEGFEHDKATPTYAEKTKFWQVNVPAGLGLRFDASDKISWGIEYLYRFTFTDRLDNVSGDYVSDEYLERYLTPEKAAVAKEMADKQWAVDPGAKAQPWTKRGNKDDKDGYSTISIMLIYKFQTNKTPWWY